VRLHAWQQIRRLDEKTVAVSWSHLTGRRPSGSDRRPHGSPKQQAVRSCESDRAAPSLAAQLEPHAEQKSETQYRRGAAESCALSQPAALRHSHAHHLATEA
jgi:hypothetical protein